MIQSNLDLGLISTITWPTRQTKTTATLIDNIIWSQNVCGNYQSNVLIDDISDHLPRVIILKSLRTSKAEPVTITSWDIRLKELKALVSHLTLWLVWNIKIRMSKMKKWQNFMTNLLYPHMHSYIQKYANNTIFVYNFEKHWSLRAWTKKIPHRVVEFKAGEEHRIVQESFYWRSHGSHQGNYLAQKIVQKQVCIPVGVVLTMALATLVGVSGRHSLGQTISCPGVCWDTNPSPCGQTDACKYNMFASWSVNIFILTQLMKTGKLIPKLATVVLGVHYEPLNSN